MSSGTDSNKKKVQHSYMCAYWKCGSRSRDNVAGIRFHKLPMYNKELVATWLINAGLDDKVEQSESELRKITICSRHFPPYLICPSGRLRKDTVPFRFEDTVEEEEPLIEDNKDWMVEKDELQREIEETNGVIRHQKLRIKELSAMVNKKHKILKRIRARLNIIINGGIISDSSLAKAVGRGIQNLL